MAQFLPFVVIGLSVGSIYGLAATGLVLTYKTSGIFNFAYGALASVSVFVFYELHDVQGWPWPLAGALCVFVVGPVMGYLLELLSRQLAAADRTLQIGAMVGLIVWIVSMSGILFSHTSGIFPAFLPTSTVRLLDVNVEWEQIIVAVVGFAAAGALYAFLRFTRRGRRAPGGGRRPGPAVRHGHELGPGPQAGLDDRVVLRGAVGAAHRAQPPAERAGSHAARRAGLQRRGDRVLHEPPAHLCGRAADGGSGRGRDQVRRERAVAYRLPVEPAVRGPVHRAARDTARQARRQELRRRHAGFRRAGTRRCARAFFPAWFSWPSCAPFPGSSVRTWPVTRARSSW